MKHQTGGTVWRSGTSLSCRTAKEAFSLNYVDYTKIIYRRIIAQRCLTVDR